MLKARLAGLSKNSFQELIVGGRPEVASREPTVRNVTGSTFSRIGSVLAVALAAIPNRSMIGCGAARFSVTRPNSPPRIGQLMSTRLAWVRISTPQAGEYREKSTAPGAATVVPQVAWVSMTSANT